MSQMGASGSASSAGVGVGGASTVGAAAGTGDVASASETAAELSRLAARQEQRNRPRVLVTLGVLAVLCGLVYAWMGWRARTDAFDLAQRAQERDERLRERLAQLASLRAEEAARGGSEDAGVFLRSTVERVGREKDLFRLDPPSSPSVTRADTRRREVYTYSVEDESLAAILAFARRAEQEVPGLRVTRVVVRPGAERWNVVLDLARWTRNEGERR